MDLTNAHTIFQNVVGTITPAAQLVIRLHDDIVFSRALGWLDPETREHPTQPDTLFDMASVSKLFTVTAFMTLVEEGRVALDTLVNMVLPEFGGLRPIRPYEDPLSPGGMVIVSESGGFVDAGRVTFHDLLTHTSGLPAWRPLYRQPTADTARQMALSTFFSYPTGTRVVYSDIGLILLGMAVERLTGHALDAAVRERVTAPLGLRNTHYLPVSSLESGQSVENIAPTEFCAWRGRRIIAEVHDENAYRLGGVAGHAGIFSTAEDVAAFGQMFLGDHKGAPLLSAPMVDTMTRCYTGGLGARRGLGFALWLPDSEAADKERPSSYPFSQRAFGHTGFTGTSLWMDPERNLVVALLTNEVYNGRQNRGIAGLRVAVHGAIVEAIDAAG
ncbi:MAG: beta-lactamase family protein [Anaerolineae bacterium]|nr:beta-lactamase family protein [Anaerolineae bacterium]